MNNAAKNFIWVAVAILGAVAFSVIALARGETINAAWIVIAGVCSYVIAYRFYARFIAYRVMGLDRRRATPAREPMVRWTTTPTAAERATASPIPSHVEAAMSILRIRRR